MTFFLFSFSRQRNEEEREREREGKKGARTHTKFYIRACSTRESGKLTAPRAAVSRAAWRSQVFQTLPARPRGQSKHSIASQISISRGEGRALVGRIEEWKRYTYEIDRGDWGLDFISCDAETSVNRGMASLSLPVYLYEKGRSVNIKKKISLTCMSYAKCSSYYISTNEVCIWRLCGILRYPVPHQDHVPHLCY